mmetsp:Transcript_37684/g.106486  ORF Transcript_37684/g.106486 Transcript_37684/m.106486 type:complete len:259 (+) Transcript_37684:71-847(+)
MKFRLRRVRPQPCECRNLYARLMWPTVDWGSGASKRWFSTACLKTRGAACKRRGARAGPVQSTSTTSSSSSSSARADGRGSVGCVCPLGTGEGDLAFREAATALATATSLFGCCWLSAVSCSWYCSTSSRGMKMSSTLTWFSLKHASTCTSSPSPTQRGSSSHRTSCFQLLCGELGALVTRWPLLRSAAHQTPYPHSMPPWSIVVDRILACKPGLPPILMQRLTPSRFGSPSAGCCGTFFKSISNAGMASSASQRCGN